MKNKRGLIGTILLGILLAVLIIVALLYFQIRTSGLQFNVGNIIIDLQYNPDQEPEIIEDIIEILPNEVKKSNETSPLHEEQNETFQIENLTSSDNSTISL